jgi:hypothetical protein
VNYPERIEQALLRIFDINQLLLNKRAAIGSLEITITVDACQAKDEKGKPLLSNETLRAAAISRMLEESEDYRKQLTEVRDLERELATVEASLERLRMEFRLEMLEAEQRNALSALKVADSIFFARHSRSEPLVNGAALVEDEIQLPF